MRFIFVFIFILQNIYAVDINKLSEDVNKHIKFQSFYSKKTFIESPESVYSLARHKTKYHHSDQLDWDKIDIVWLSSFDKKIMARILVKLLYKITVQDNFTELYQNFHPNNKKFNLLSEAEYLIEEFKKVDTNAKVTRVIAGRIFLENDIYERDWSPLMKLMYRWEQRIPGLRDALIKELSYIID